jgi:hypothetical protein
MTLPNFLVIGAAKSGTDALCDYLNQHPDIFVSRNKEPNFFIAEGRPDIPYRGPGDREVLQRLDQWVSTRERYEALFAPATSEKAIGEGTTWYLYDEQAPHRIRRLIPEVKLIASLRNPVDRAYSAFTMLLRDGRETTTDFTAALGAEDGRLRAGWEPMWHYRRMGFYHRQLIRYLSVFGPEQIMVLLQEDIALKPQQTLSSVYAFLGVDHEFQPDTSVRRNVSLVPVHVKYHRLVEGPSSIKTLVKAAVPADTRSWVKKHLPASQLSKPEPMPTEARSTLVETFREDVLALQDLLSRDLRHWLR